jgi:hypothetical protein
VAQNVSDFKRGRVRNMTLFLVTNHLLLNIKHNIIKISERGYLSGTALGYGLNDRGVLVPKGAWNFSLHHSVLYYLLYSRVSVFENFLYPSSKNNM